MARFSLRRVTSFAKLRLLTAVQLRLTSLSKLI